jgi:DNA-binding CsgD family transcriptional regulator
MLIEDASICQSLRNIIGRLRADPALQDDLMQECLIRLWKLEIEKPGRTQSWYLQSCRFHLQHWLASGRSLDSLKRANGDKRITIDGVNEELPVKDYHTNGELFESVCAGDIVSTLAGHLRPRESAVLGGLAEGLVLHDIAVKLKLSYPTALKYRRKIAALAIRLGISPLPPYKRSYARRARRPHGIARRHTSVVINGVERPDAFGDIFRADPPAWSKLSGRSRADDFDPVIHLTQVESLPPRANVAAHPVT